MIKSISAFSIFLPSELEEDAVLGGGGVGWGGGGELFTRKVTVRGHGKEPAVFLLLLLLSALVILSSLLSPSSHSAAPISRSLGPSAQKRKSRTATIHKTAWFYQSTSSECSNSKLQQHNKHTDY